MKSDIELWLNYKIRLTSKTKEEILLKFKQDIVAQIYLDEEFKSKLKGMVYRNGINSESNIEQDVLSEVVYQLMKYDNIKLIDAYCDNYKRVFALAVTIATRAGFGKLNAEIHPNASVAKQILFGSNINKSEYFCNTTETIVKDGETIRHLFNEEKSGLWEIIRDNLNDEENKFLDFILDNVLNKKYSQSYDRNLRKSHYTFNEYKILRLSLQNRIKDILKNNI